MTRKHILAALVTAAALTVAAPAFAVDEYNVSNGITLTGNPLGMHGFDPVSMFKSEAPGLGDAVHTSAHNGIDYYFATAATKEQFDANPEAFLPQFGGFCAFGTAMGYKFDGDPHVWKIVDDKLYLNLSKAVSKRWNEDVPGYIKTANEKWQTIADKAPSDLQ